MEGGEAHMAFLAQLGVIDILRDKLYEIAKSNFNFMGAKSDQYHIARKISPGESKEAYRAHFDSHLFTLVLPIKIPVPMAGESCGELDYFPRIRSHPRNEIKNMLGKLGYKAFASEKGIKLLAQHQTMLTNDFADFRPLLFIGNTTLHSNREVSASCEKDRLTLLAHFFDPSPGFSVGAIFRKVRSR